MSTLMAETLNVSCGAVAHGLAPLPFDQRRWILGVAISPAADQERGHRQRGKRDRRGYQRGTDAEADRQYRKAERYQRGLVYGRRPTASIQAHHGRDRDARPRREHR
jgi:hypothetical protein